MSNRNMENNKKIFIDPCCQVTQIDFDIRNREKAESRNRYSHFCPLSSLNAILKTKAIKFNNISNFSGTDEYERKNVEPKFWGQIFIFCLTTDSESNEMWNDFGDDENGVRIDFNFQTNFLEDIFDSKRMVKTISTDGKELDEIGFATSTVSNRKFSCSPNKFTQPIADISMMDVAYTDTPEDSHAFIDSTKVVNMSSVSTAVCSKFSDENETRVRCVLRCTHDVYMDKISYLLVPIKFKYISLEFGKKVEPEKRKYYSNILEKLKRNEENLD